jgi:hypothetical protein
VIASLLGAVWVLAFVGLRYPLQMLPTPDVRAGVEDDLADRLRAAAMVVGTGPPDFAEDFSNIVFGVVLMPLVIPWGYVYRHYVKQRANRWR